MSLQRPAYKHLTEALSSTFQTLPEHSKCSTDAEPIAAVLDAAQTPIAASYEAETYQMLLFSDLPFPTGNGKQDSIPYVMNCEFISRSMNSCSGLGPKSEPMSAKRNYEPNR